MVTTRSRAGRPSSIDRKGGNAVSKNVPESFSDSNNYSNECKPALSSSSSSSSSNKLPLLPLAVVIYLLPRVLLLSSSHSGSSSSPHSSANHGDYQAHRKWSSYWSLPASLWYTYELDYWGADYPPLCMYLHAAIGRFTGFIDPVQTDLSVRGYEGGLVLMRLINISLELLAFVPVAYLIVKRNGDVGDGGIGCRHLRDLQVSALVIALTSI